jgi:predicted nucleotidyltransferase
VLSAFGEYFVKAGLIEPEYAKMIVRTDLGYLTPQETGALEAFVRRVRRGFDDRVLSVILFGSRARGDAQPDSDVDLVVIVDRDDLETSKAIRHLAIETWLEWGLYLSTRVWGQAHWQRLQALQTGLYRNLQREGRELLWR